MGSVSTEVSCAHGGHGLAIHAIRAPRACTTCTSLARPFPPHKTGHASVKWLYCPFVPTPTCTTAHPLTCTSQRALSSQPDLPRKCHCCSRRGFLPSAEPVHPADPVVSVQWTGSLCAWCTGSPAAAGRPQQSGSVRWCCLTPTWTQNQEKVQCPQLHADYPTIYEPLSFKGTGN